MSALSQSSFFDKDSLAILFHNDFNLEQLNFNNYSSLLNCMPKSSSLDARLSSYLDKMTVQFRREHSWVFVQWSNPVTRLQFFMLVIKNLRSANHSVILFFCVSSTIFLMQKKSLFHIATRSYSLVSLFKYMLRSGGPFGTTFQYSELWVGLVLTCKTILPVSLLCATRCIFF